MQGGRKLTRRQALIVTFCLLTGFFATAHPVLDPDTFWHLSVGRQILVNRTVYFEDTFSFTHTALWVNVQWLAQIILFLVYDFSGIIGLEAFALLLKVTIFIILFLALDGPPLTRAWLTLLASVLAYPVISGARPQLFSYLFLAFLSLWFRQLRGGDSRPPWWLPLLFLLWSNLHSFYPIGLGLIGIFLMGDWLNRRFALSPTLSPRLIRPLIIILIVSILACLVTPFGPFAFYQVLKNIFQSAGLPIEEWRPIAQSGHPVSLFFGVFIVLWVAAASLTPKKPDASELGFGALLTLAALSGIRMVGLWAIMMSPFLSEHIHFWTARGQTAPPKWIPNAFLAVAVILAMLVILTKLSPHEYQRAEQKEYPQRAIAHLQSLQREGTLSNPIRCLTAYHWGGYVSWRLYPKAKVFVDGRADYYPRTVMQDYLQLHGGQPRWRSLLTKYQVDAVLLPPKYPLASLLRTQKERWVRVYADKTAVLFVRRDERRATK
ncbi:MAG: hypothetical protein NZ959_04525 [Armatimonadetes bacterium]|nr:hypothetical protein [Armatimonadota bacterium]MDW8121829.1 hypothetical protein [Armatimonadota bacterium]